MRNIRIIQFMVADCHFVIALTYALAILAMIIPPFSDSIDPEQTDVPHASCRSSWDSRSSSIISPTLYKLVLDNVGLDEVFRIFIAVIVTDVIVGLPVLLSDPQLLFHPRPAASSSRRSSKALLLSGTRMLKRILKPLSGLQAEAARRQAYAARSAPAPAEARLRRNPQQRRTHQLPGRLRRRRPDEDRQAACRACQVYGPIVRRSRS
ncbi:MAG: hypothetical protein M0C28_18945 [Candidatus Moduliflexus flocculans]|nr:hypothetical protein [Candidatus Moduliflexus flocculans]